MRRPSCGRPESFPAAAPAWSADLHPFAPRLRCVLAFNSSRSYVHTRTVNWDAILTQLWAHPAPSNHGAADALVRRESDSTAQQRRTTVPVQHNPPIRCFEAPSTTSAIIYKSFSLCEPGGAVGWCCSWRRFHRRRTLLPSLLPRRPHFLSSKTSARRRVLPSRTFLRPTRDILSNP